MNILVVGASGKTGRHILPLLKQAGHTPRAMVRNYDYRDDMEALGAEVVAGDLEKPLGHAVGDNRACIFVAGSGSKTGPEKTIDVDFHGAVSLIETCERKKVRRFIMLSAMNTEDPESGPEKLRRSLELFARHVIPHFKGFTRGFHDEWQIIKERHEAGGFPLNTEGRPSNLGRYEGEPSD